MAQGIFNWLNASKPPVGFTDYEYPEAGDVRQPGDAHPLMTTPDISPYEGQGQTPGPNYHPTPAGSYDDEGRMMLPDTSDNIYREPAPDPRVMGREGATEWDYTTELVPVYAVPPEMGGGEYVGELRYAPSLPQNLQPIRFVRVGKTEKLI